LAADPKSRPFTVTALRNGLALGLTESEMRQVVLRLSRRDFYKAMTSHAGQQVWQDVYHGMTEDGIPVYIKITGLAGDRPPVIQFKAK
jgi:motility quorum-sensing regulator/GCU-specific mRNA interferase toxin